MLGNSVLAVLFLLCVGCIYATRDNNELDSTQNLIENEELRGEIKIVTKNRDNKEFLFQHPSGIHVEYLTQNQNVGDLLHYAMGSRTRLDQLVASGGNNQSWTSPQNVNVQLTYPAQGYGASITYVAILVNQTTNLGQAYVVKGGINQRMISIIVEAYNTYYFNYFAYIYGV